MPATRRHRQPRRASPYKTAGKPWSRNKSRGGLAYQLLLLKRQQGPPQLASTVKKQQHSGKRWSKPERAAIKDRYEALCVQFGGGSYYRGVYVDVWLEFCTPFRRPKKQRFCELVRLTKARAVSG